ncbi:MAG: PhzF family phenazine biosynthesis protein [Cyclobacteriaceae bacterium]|nr:PhzF family phenazine biosynthesis protein [Cyclobacteriaceae bacterium]
MIIYQVDAFTDHVFGGNPAAVCPMQRWPKDELMQQIAMENNLSETAFFVQEEDGFHIRWFTPEVEIDLCGHATLASAHVIFHHLHYQKPHINFRYGGGLLSVQKEGKLLSMNFPAIASMEAPVTDQLTMAMRKKPGEVFKARDAMAIYESEQDILELQPDFVEMAKLDCMGVIATAPGENVDFVSRFFGPKVGINEDPVTGSAHCMLVPYWASRLGKSKLNARQLSKRTGTLFCEHKNDRVLIAGEAVTFMIGEINL